jgi:hypothetical protein
MMQWEEYNVWEAQRVPRHRCNVSGLQVGKTRLFRVQTPCACLLLLDDFACHRTVYDRQSRASVIDGGYSGPIFYYKNDFIWRRCNRGTSHTTPTSRGRLLGFFFWFFELVVIVITRCCRTQLILWRSLLKCTDWSAISCRICFVMFFTVQLKLINMASWQWSGEMPIQLCNPLYLQIL